MMMVIIIVDDVEGAHEVKTEEPLIYHLLH